MNKKILLFFALLLSVCNLQAQTTKAEQTLIDNFLQDWSFWSDTNPNKVTVTLPHDAMQTETRKQFKGGQHSGYYPGNVYHYEKTINIDKATFSKHIALKFEGVYRNATVSINGKQVASNKYGWTQFTANLDANLKVGKNVIRVDADNSQVPNSRWYTGAGIYRPVHLVIQSKTHIDNVKILATQSPISVKTTHNAGTVNIEIYDGKTKVAQAEGDNVKINIPNAKLWSAENPYLYKAAVTLKQNGKVVDTQEQEFGIRQISYSHDKGLMVNGKTVKLKGGCLHSDIGILGAAEYDDFAMRKIAIMKQYGFNAIRSAHNPCSEALLKACDKLGMYVMDELWDVWYDHKTPYDYATDFRANYQKDVDAFVEKDYNHPSVILYSIANEPTEVAKQEGVAMSKNIVDRLHSLDDSRPVTAGINLVIAYMSSLGINLTSADNAGAVSGTSPKKMSSEEYNQMMAVSGQKLLDGVMKPEVDSVTTPEFETLDIAGYNYGSRRYEQDATEHPDRIIVGTETYPYSLAENWAKVEKLPYLIGDFQWTVWDYNGEVGLGAWYHSNENSPSIKPYPWKLAYAGSIDLIGNPTGEAFLAKAIWDKDDKPYIGVRPIDNRPLIKGMWRGTDAIPSWSWRGCEGMPATVEVFTSAKTVDLYLNDKFIGTKPVKDYVATFSVPYQPGTLKAVTTSADGTKHEGVLKSADSDLDISITSESFAGKGLLFVDINITDKNGIVESNADRMLTVKVDGGKLLGFGSAQPCTDETFQSGKYTTYFGQSQAIIRPGKGKVTIIVSGEGLPTTTRTI